MIDAAFLTSLLSIIGLNLVLAGDNAIVIALASRGLPHHLQRRAIILGTALAVVLRIVLTVGVALLLRIPMLQLAGGLMLLVIAWRLGTADDDPDISSSSELRAAILTIVGADIAMSLDNVLAIAAAAKGDLWLIMLGLAISIPIVTGGATVILQVLTRYPAIVMVGVALVTYTGMELIFDDRIVSSLVEQRGVSELAVAAVSWGITILLTLATAAASRKPPRSDCEELSTHA